jgi:hypothetical protein
MYDSRDFSDLPVLGLEDRLQASGLDPVAADAKLRVPIHMGEQTALAAKSDDLEANALAAFAHLLGVEAREAQAAERLDPAAHHRRLAAAGRPGQQPVLRRPRRHAFLRLR